MIRSLAPASSAATSLESSICSRTSAVSCSFAAPLTRLPSARPLTLGMTIAITLPMSFGDVGAGLGDRVGHDRPELLVGDLLGQVALDQLRLALGLAGQVVAAALAEGLGGLQPALALALEHLDLVAGAVLLRLLQLGHHHAQRARALAVARLQRGVGVGLHSVRAPPLGSSVGPMPAWKVATFDCYGTLIDWEGGAAAFLYDLARRNGDDDPGARSPAAPALGGDPVRAHPEQDYRSYDECSSETLRTWVGERGYRWNENEGDDFARSMQCWQPFPDTIPALTRVREAGMPLAIVSNSDNAIMDHTLRQLPAAGVR